MGKEIAAQTEGVWHLFSGFQKDRQYEKYRCTGRIKSYGPKTCINIFELFIKDKLAAVFFNPDFAALMVPASAL